MAAEAPPAPRPVFLYATAPDAETATALARRLVEDRLIACGNVLPGLRSVYRWEGAVTEEAEAALLCKTTADRADAALARLAELHPYDVPAVTRFDAADAWPPFAAWVAAEVAPPDAPGASAP